MYTSNAKTNQNILGTAAAPSKRKSVQAAVVTANHLRVFLLSSKRYVIQKWFKVFIKPALRVKRLSMEYVAIK